MSEDIETERYEVRVRGLVSYRVSGKVAIWQYEENAAWRLLLAASNQSFTDRSFVDRCYTYVFIILSCMRKLDEDTGDLSAAFSLYFYTHHIIFRYAHSIFVS